MMAHGTQSDTWGIREESLRGLSEGRTHQELHNPTHTHTTDRAKGNYSRL